MASPWSWPEIWQAYLWPLLVMVLQSVVLLVALLIVIAFLLLMDRKVWAAVQLRRGPNVVGPFGLLQSFADLLKFVLKEPLIPAGADKGVFLKADQRISYGQARRVMDVLHEAGIDDVQLGTEEATK